MKPFLALSLAANLALALLVGYLLGLRGAAPLVVSNPPPPLSPSAPVVAPVESVPTAVLTPAPRPVASAALSALPSGPQAPPVHPSIPSLSAVEPGAELSVATAVEISARRPRPASARQISNPPVARPQNGSAPGNFLRFRGSRISLAETYDSGEDGQRALAIDISPSEDVPSADGTSDSVAMGTNSDPSETVSTRDRERKRTSHDAPTGGVPPSADERLAEGELTYEDELFRMKWGWAAFDAARSEARREAGSRR